MIRLALSGLGILSLAVGIIGIFVPLLPTTPFLLLSAALFLKSSNRLYLWLTTHRIFGKYISNYLENRSIPLMTKLMALILLWISISFGIIFILSTPHFRVALAIIALAVTVHIVRLKTAR
ncbi:MAG: YbaN family protein [Fibrobacteres bacterium]|nr:YbaN family protein [Fibrobacterota bacterium]